VVGSYEHGNKTLGFITDRDFLDKLSDSQLPKQESAL
jgi:hypothetical protein